MAFKPGQGRPSAFVAALRALARRELSAAQLRTRLLAREYPTEDVESALERLAADGRLDDRRVAAAAARQSVSLKARGPSRVLRELQARGIAPGIARDAVRDAFAETDEATLIERVLDRQATAGAASQRELARLYRTLLRRGFSPGLVHAALRKRFGSASDE